MSATVPAVPAAATVPATVPATDGSPQDGPQGLAAVAVAVDAILPAPVAAAHPAVAYTLGLWGKMLDKFPDTATKKDVIEASRAFVGAGKPASETQHKPWRAARRLHDVTEGMDDAVTIAELRALLPALCDTLHLAPNGRAVAKPAAGSAPRATGSGSRATATATATDAAIVRMLRGAPAGMTVADFRAAVATGNYGSPIAQTTIGNGLTLPGIAIAPYVAPDPVAVAVAAPAVHAAIAAFLTAQAAAAATGDTAAVAAALDALQAATAPQPQPARPIVRCPVAVAQQPGGEWQRAQRRAVARRAFRAAVAANVAAWQPAAPAPVAAAPQPAAPAPQPNAGQGQRDRNARRAQRAA